MGLKLSISKITLFILFAATFTGCESVRYYTQAISGQVSILNKRQSINRLLADLQIPAKQKNQFRRILDLREFAQKELNLPVNNHYLTFVELNRPYVLWNVYAAPEFDFAPKTWCYPIVGCTAYRGYFSKTNAHRYAEQLNQEGFDVYVGGVTAYSTLGWFDDPIYSTFIDFSEARLAALIFHELAHQIVYVKDDTTFNESFATAVEQEGLRRWMESRGKTDAYHNYLRAYERRLHFNQLIQEYRKKLESLYEKNMPIEEKRREKEYIIYRLKDEYYKLNQHWNGYAGYDPWFRNSINNAQINTVSIYNDMAPAFLELIEQNGGDLSLFYETCQKLARYSKKERIRRLNEELGKGMN